MYAKKIINKVEDISTKLTGESMIDLFKRQVKNQGKYSDEDSLIVVNFIHRSVDL